LQLDRRFHERSVESTLEENIATNPSLILCPLSLLPSGKSAIVQALSIARWYEAEVHILLVGGPNNLLTNMPHTRGLSPTLSSAS
jgi:hypothetical protein